MRLSLPLLVLLLARRLTLRTAIPFESFDASSCVTQALAKAFPFGETSNTWAWRVSFSVMDFSSTSAVTNPSRLAEKGVT